MLKFAVVSRAHLLHCTVHVCTLAHARYYQSSLCTGPGSSTGPSTSLLELMNEVATQTNKWECIALELELSHNDIERIKLEEQGRIQDCFRRVFSKWETKVDPPFTWPVIIRALESPSVTEFRLALELKRKYLAVTV